MRNHEITSDYTSMIPNKIPANANFKLDKSGLSNSDRLTHVEFWERISKSVSNSVFLNVFVTVLI